MGSVHEAFEFLVPSFISGVIELGGVSRIIFPKQIRGKADTKRILNQMACPWEIQGAKLAGFVQTAGARRSDLGPFIAHHQARI